MDAYIHRDPAEKVGVPGWLLGKVGVPECSLQSANESGTPDRGSGCPGVVCETTWYQGVASSETRVERGWVIQDSFRGI